MSFWTRRRLLQAGLAASAGALAAQLPKAAATSTSLSDGTTPAAELLASAGATPQISAVPATLRRQNLDQGWHFHLGNTDVAAADFQFGRNQETFAKAIGAAAPARANYDDSAWEAVDLPHDWAVDLPFQEDRSLVDHGSKPLGRAYPATSVGWYRRHLEIPADAQGQRVGIEFDGVFRHAMVFFNGEYLGENFSGYAPFRFDLTDLALFGGANAVVVRVDATLGEGWFYEGAGIYRHVWLTRTAPLHFAADSTVVRSTPRANGGADLQVLTTARNHTAGTVRCRVTVNFLDADGQPAATAHSASVDVPAEGDAELEAHVSLAHARLWSLEQRHLYRAACTLESDGARADHIEVPFGVRSIRFDPDHGFFLNGVPVKLQGTCNHQDHAGVGAALPDRLQSFRIERLKAMGCNAYRTSHNLPTPELLDACDRLGMLVMDETRMMASTREGLSQLERLIRRDRNHPSVVLWSLGNEEPQQGTEIGARVVATMKRLANRLDPTRPVTLAMNGGWGRGASAVVDVQGFNYGNGGGSAQTAPHIDDFHRRFPHQPCVGSETASTVSTRGIYFNDAVRGYVSAYDVNFPSYALNAEGWWKIFAVRPFLAGGFAWTGFDYRGEPSPYGWPCISSHFGILDTCGFPKDNFFYYQAWWTQRPVLHLFPHWNWSGKEGQPIAVWCHTNLPEVELFLNGTSLGRQAVERYGHTAWQVPYAPGVIEARGVASGGAPLTSRRETTGAAARVVLTPDRAQIAADAADLAVVTVEIQDAQGRQVPTADNLVRFAVSGPARILGVGNGDPSSHEPDHASQRSAFNGLCMVLVQSRGEAGAIVLTATADGLEMARATLMTGH